MKNHSSRKKSFTGISGSLCVSLLLIVFTCLQARAQNAEFTQNSSTTRAVDVDVPLVNYPVTEAIYALELPTNSYADPSLSGVLIQKVHVAELHQRVQ